MTSTEALVAALISKLGTETTRNLVLHANLLMPNRTDEDATLETQLAVEMAAPLRDAARVTCSDEQETEA